jgi:hypothetical protein
MSLPALATHHLFTSYSGALKVFCIGLKKQILGIRSEH